MVDRSLSTASQVLTRRRGLPVSERRLLLISVDLLSAAIAFVIAFNLRTSEVRHAGFYVPRLGTLVAVVLWLVCGAMVNAFDLRGARQIRSIFRATSTTVAAVFMGMLVFFFIVPYQITRPTLALWVPIAWVLDIGGRLAYRRVVAGTYFAGRIAIVADPHVFDRVWPEVRGNLHGLYSVVTVINPSREDCGDRLRALMLSHDVDHVVLGVRDEMSRELFRQVLACHDHGLSVRSLADLYEEVTGRLLLDQLGHTWLMALPMRSQTSFLFAAFKRTIDVVVAALSLVGLGLLLIPVAPMILADRGPLFHRQQRIGQYGNVFTLYKLRTMRHDPEAATVWTQARDRRVTRVGRVLRRLHLDELPQAWAILVGDMSLVGPRPEQPQYVDELRSQIDFYNTRLTVRPGLTGWAQVNSGYSSDVEGARVKLSYDLYYIKHQSAALDLLIMTRTVLAVLSLNGR